jgi:hypothetical protein
MKKKHVKPKKRGENEKKICGKKGKKRNTKKTNMWYRKSYSTFPTPFRVILYLSNM